MKLETPSLLVNLIPHHLRLEDTPLGEAPDTDPANDFAAKEIGIKGQKGYEATLPETNVTFSFEPVGTGYRVTAEFV